MQEGFRELFARAGQVKKVFVKQGITGQTTYGLVSHHVTHPYHPHASSEYTTHASTHMW